MKKRKLISWVLALGMLTSGINTAFAADDNLVTTTNHYSKGVFERRMEKLSRGLVAIRTENGTFLSWRLFDGEDARLGSAEGNVSFAIYKNGTKIATEEDATNYTDTSGSASDKYQVAPIVNGTEGEKCDAVSVNADNYFDIPLVKPATETVEYKVVSEDDSGNEVITTETIDYSFSPADCSVGDLDGDGEYEIVVKWTSAEKDVGSPGSPAYSGTVRLAAYKLDGTKLWDSDVNLGKNIYSSAHTLQFLVYDFNCDGKAEVICQTSLGSKDSKGEYVSHAADKTAYPAIYNLTDAENAEADFRSVGWGLITSGEEFLTVFNGETGEAIDTITLPTGREVTKGDNGASYGDTSGNRSNRFVSDVAHLDGEKPYAIFMRGYYFGRNGKQRTSIAGISFDGERLSPDYRFDTEKGQPGYYSGAEIYVGNGNHNCTVADVDGDGKDEFITGALCMEVDDNNNFRPRWCTFMEHGDALHIGDYDPTHEGFEFFTVHEDLGPNTMSGQEVAINYGMSVIDADTGEVMLHVPGSDDTGRGVMASVGASGYYQVWSAKTDAYKSNGGTNFSETTVSGASQNFRIFWDGDLYDELLDGVKLTNWDGSSMVREVLPTNGEFYAINGSKANPSVQADLFGDWREEIVYPVSDGTALRVFTTTTPTEYKIKTLMHDPVYRNGVAAQQTAYNQPPHVGFYLDEEMFLPKITKLELTEPSKLEYKIGDELDLTGMKLVAYYDNNTNEEITDYTVKGYDKGIAGNQEITVEYRGVTKTFNVNVATGFTVDANGYITGYTETDSEAVLPFVINGVRVVGINDGALSSASFDKFTVYTDILDIGDNAFKSGVTIECYEESDADIYAQENAITTEYISASSNAVVDVDYEDDKYNTINWVQGGETQTNVLDGVTYTVGGRSSKGQPAGDGQTGFVVVEEEDNSYIHARYGRFGNGGRNASLAIANSPEINADSTVELSMDLYFESSELGDVKLVLNDGANDITSITYETLGNEDEWYNYSIICRNGVYTQRVKKADGTLVSESVIGEIGEKMISSIAVLSDNSTAHNDQHVAVRIDNLSMTTPSISSVRFTVNDKWDTVISGAKVEVAGNAYYADENGIVELELNQGRYTAKVTADNYVEKTMDISVRQDYVLYDIELRSTVDDGDSKVTFTVTDSDGKAVQNAKVTVNGSEYTTGSTGTVSAKLSDGKYTAVITRNSLSVEKQVTVSGANVNVNVCIDYAEVVKTENNVYTFSSPCAQTVVAIYPVYNADGAMTSCSIETVELSEGTDTYTAESGEVLIWSAFSDMVPILSK